ncbi:MAG: hypothetical protein JOZ41_15645 [Chloroflexi bacterium]|nr:hypothetical protein [Chloroflexota bacterium]
MIPPFESGTGKLPPGEHEATWAEVARRFGTTAQRQQLLQGLRSALDALARAGCRRVWLNGSFVTAKETPQDFDLCWDRSGVEAHLLDPVLLDLSNKRAGQHATFGGAVWPADFVVESGNTILTDFQRDYKNNDRPKGIVVIDPTSASEEQRTSRTTEGRDPQ